MRKLALATQLFSLLRRAFARKFNDKGDSESEVSDISVDVAIGTPKDTNRHWRKVKHIKLNRCYTFLEPVQRVFAFDLALRVFLPHDYALQVVQTWHVVQPSEGEGSVQHL